jgi:hypothetical protein
MDESTWYLFLLLPRWCLRYTQGGPLGQQEVSTHLRRFLANE